MCMFSRLQIEFIGLVICLAHRHYKLAHTMTLTTWKFETENVEVTFILKLFTSRHSILDDQYPKIYIPYQDF